VLPLLEAGGQPVRKGGNQGCRDVLASAMREVREIESRILAAFSIMPSPPARSNSRNGYTILTIPRGGSRNAVKGFRIL
jgi:hypothetical protein